MMPVIKGGVCFKKGEPIPQKVLDAIDVIKTPFGDYDNTGKRLGSKPKIVKKVKKKKVKED